MRISDWSSDVCSSDLPNLSAGFHRGRAAPHQYLHLTQLRDNLLRCKTLTSHPILHSNCPAGLSSELDQFSQGRPRAAKAHRASAIGNAVSARSEEHTSELQSLMRISYAFFCLKKTNKTH